MKILIPVFLLAGGPLSYAQDEDTFAGGRSRIWFGQLSGNMETQDIEIATNISFDGDLGFGTRETLPDFTAWIHVPFIPILDRINFAYWFGDFQESETLERSITFGNQTFTLGTQIESELEFSLLTFSLEHFFLSSGDGTLGCTMGASLGVKFFEAEATLEEDSFGLREKQELKAPFPVIGLHFLVHMTEWVTLEMEMVGSGGRYGSLEGRYFEWFLEASFRPLEWIHLGFGYKAALFGMEDRSDEGFEASIRLDGIFFSAGFQF